MDSLFDIITWAQIQHLSDTVARLGDLVAKITITPKPAQVDIFARWITAIPILISIYSLWKNQANTKEIERLKTDLGKELKEHEYSLMYRKVVTEKRLEVYQELNNLISEFGDIINTDGQEDLDEKYILNILEKMKEYDYKFFIFIKNIFFINKPTAMLFFKFKESIKKMTEPESFKEGYREAGNSIGSLFKAIAIDIKNLHNLDLWKPEN